jgi:hypothetical protein
MLLQPGVLQALTFLLDVPQGGVATFVQEKNCAAEGVLAISVFLILGTGIVVLAWVISLL